MRIFNSKRRVALASLVAITGMALVPVVHAAVQFGPDRPTYTWTSPADHITFNSITNNPDTSVGDERTFIAARDAASSDKLTYNKDLTVKDNEEVIVRVFYHNDAASNLNLVATNTKVKVLLPSGTSTAPQAAAYISADNATPSMVWSTMDFSAGGQPFSMTYEPGTAQLWNQKQVGTKLSDSVATDGALIGFDQIDGKIPGCSEFSGVITIKARVHVTPPVTPQSVYSCDLLHVTSQGNRAYNYSVDATAKNGATITGYTFDFGDGNTVSSTANSTSHTYAKDGTYTTTATVKFNVGGSEKTATCSQNVTVSTPATPTTPSTPATTLPNTGAGDVVGLFAGASAAGTAAHAIVTRRKRGL